VNLIRENPRYTKMTPEEILRKFVSGRMMVKEARYVDDALNGPLPVYEPQPVVLKATSSKEALPSKVAQVEAFDLKKMRWRLSSSASRSHLKDARSTPTRTKQGESAPASNAVRLVILLLNVPIMKMTRDKKDMGRRRRRKAIGRRKARLILEKNGIPTAPHLTPTMRDWRPRPSTSLISSPTNVIHVLWLRKRRYMFEIPLSTLLLVMMILPMMK
jgi:hypothetical protein